MLYKRRTRLQSFCLFLILFGVLSCKKDQVSIESVYNPTPFNLEIPSFATNYLGNPVIPENNPLTAEGIRLGRKLFYEKLLSDDESMSCASCHLQVNSFGDPNPFSQGTNGAFGDRNAMNLINLAWSPSLFWDGRSPNLESQAHDPVTNPVEMRNDWPTVVSRLQSDSEYPELFFEAFGTNVIDSLLVTKAIAQFERSMLSFNSPFDKFFFGGDTSMLNVSQKNGYDLFFGDAECIHCHLGPLLTDNTFRNNGLDINHSDLGLGGVTGIASDNGKFKVPTLRNIAQSAPYMHDGRFASLQDVIEFYNSGVQSASPNLDTEMDHFTTGLNLTQQQKNDLLNFLLSFTDDEFITNDSFSDPN